MHRLWTLLRVELLNQTRNAFYAIVALVVVFMIGGLRLLDQPDSLDRLLPGLFLGGVAATTYMFAGSLILLEKAQGTLDGLVVTPVRPHEYLLARCITLGLLGTLEGVAVVLATHGPAGLSVVPMMLGMLAMSMFFALVGIGVAVRYDDVPRFLLPSIFIIVGLQLPFFDQVGVWSSPALYAVPTMPALVLIRAGFEPLSAAHWTYAILGTLATLGAAAVWARRAFVKRIVEKSPA